MKFYIAARFSRRAEAAKLAASLTELGHTCTATWITDDSHVTGSDDECALHDFRDVAMCDKLIALAEEPRGTSRGGRHVEMGMALGMYKAVVVIGPRETVFHYLPNVKHFPTVAAFMDDALNEPC